VTGLKRDDFTLLDQDNPQPIDLFHIGLPETKTPASLLAPGAVSNRVNSRGEALPNATVLLFDQLNVRLDFKA